MHTFQKMNDQISVAQNYIDKVVNLGFDYGPKLIGAIIVLIVGLWVIKLATKMAGKSLQKAKLDQSLVSFMMSLTNVLLKVLLFITVMGMVGIQMTSFIAILGAAGLAVGMALSGTLQNFAGGVIVLVFKPFKVGDFIEAQGFSGTVKEISIFTTHLNTVDKKLIVIPNGPLSTASLTNYSTEPLRRVDWKFVVAYKDNMEDFKKSITTFIAEDSRILKEPAYFMGFSELGDSSASLVVRAWVNNSDYWDVHFQMNEKVYKLLKDNKLNTPAPQMVVHLQDKK